MNKNDIVASIFFDEDGIHDKILDNTWTAQGETSEYKFKYDMEGKFSNKVTRCPHGNTYFKLKNPKELSFPVTISFWSYRDQARTWEPVIGFDNNTATLCTADYGRDSQYGCRIGTYYVTSNTKTIPLNEWVHFGATLKKTSDNTLLLTMYQNGYQVENTTLSNCDSYFKTLRYIYFNIGQGTSAGGGYLDDILILNNTLLYNRDFTPPVSPYFKSLFEKQLYLLEDSSVYGIKAS